MQVVNTLQAERTIGLTNTTINRLRLNKIVEQYQQFIIFFLSFDPNGAIKRQEDVMTLTTQKITDRIVLVSAKTQTQLGSAFIRFQEHYESPEWRGKIFTEGQLRAWYSEKYGANTYEHDWTGFNLPGSILRPFIQGLFDPLGPAEAELVNLFRYRTDEFYVIGSQTDQLETLDHEICHGLFATVSAYREAVQKILRANHKQLTPLRKRIESLMYHPSVVEDEVHAYASGSIDLVREDWGIEVPDGVHVALRAVRDRHYQEGE